MAFTTYTNKQDTNLPKDFLLNQPDIYISKHEYEGTGVIDLTVPASATLTPAVSPTWTVDDFNSTVGINIEVIDDNGKLAYGSIDDTDATSITFDSTALVLDEDGVTAPTFTDTNTYSFRVLSPSSVYKWGDFFGYINDVSLGFEQESAEFKYGIPRELIVEDLIENINSLTGTMFSMQNENVLAAILGMIQFGNQTGQYELGFTK